MICPYCEKKIGTESNQLVYQTFPMPTEGKKKKKSSVIHAMYCSRCGKVLGVVSRD